MTERISSLYAHVPFCARKCEYCAFYSEPSSGGEIDRFVDALIREMEMAAPEGGLQTVFFGGGTPSLLNVRQWERVLEAMRRLGLLGAAEWTVECNPATLTAEKARLLRSAGVNRLSIGVQSFDEGLLDRLGRVHDRPMIFRTVELCRAAGFDNLNLDLMFAIPGQTMAMWQETLREAVALGSEHLSSYEVIYEEDTPLYRQLQAGSVDVNEDLACEMYDELVAFASSQGFTQYEIANFALGPLVPGAGIPERACRHNVNYWRGGGFHGFGPSATSYVRGVRTRNIANTRFYCEQLEKGRRAIESREELSPLSRAGETAAFGLRMTRGWRFGEFREVTGFDLRNEWNGDMNELAQTGWAQRTEEGFRLTPTGMRFADAVAERFLR